LINILLTGIKCDFCQFLALGGSTLYVSSEADNIKALRLSQELNSSYQGSILAGSLGFTTCSNDNAPYCSGDSDGYGTNARFNVIVAIALLKQSNSDAALFLADAFNSKIRVLDLKTYKTITVDTLPGLVQPTGLAVNNAGTVLYVSTSNVVYKYASLNSTFQNTVPRTIVTGSALVNQPLDGYSARFGFIVYLEIDAAGNLYVSDLGGDEVDPTNNAIRRIYL